MKGPSGVLLICLSTIVLWQCAGENISTVIYVSSNGTDEAQCLSSAGGIGHPCKTLGYVLGNIATTHCTNCTIMVTYSHKVFHDFNDSHVANLASVEHLHIVGIGMPVLDYAGSGVLLKSNSNTASVVIESVKINDCFGLDETDDSCIGITNDFFLQQFSLLNVIANNVWGVSVIAQNAEFKNSWFNGTVMLNLLAPPFTNFSYQVTNCTFTDVNTGYSSGDIIHIEADGSQLSGAILIEDCIFSNSGMSLDEANGDTMISINILPPKSSDDTRSINITLQNTKLENRSILNYLDVNTNAGSNLHGSITIINNTFCHNYIKGNIIKLKVSIGNILLINPFTIILSSNTFAKNTGNLMHFSSVTLLIIAKSTFVNNIGDSYIISYGDTSQVLYGVMYLLGKQYSLIML